MARIKFYNPDTGQWEYADQAFTPNSGNNSGDGFSPIAKVTQTDSGAVISVTDKDGTTTATITNGKDGESGVYVLADGETIADAPSDADVVVDPSGEADATMQPLTFTGAVNTTYDGSQAVEVKIPVGGGGQADWKQNDPTAPDYVKNRPFHTDMSEITVEVTDKKLDGFPAFVAGDTVTIKVDGVTHTLEAYNDEDVPAIGDTWATVDSGNGTLGWTIYVYNSVVTFYSLDSHTVSYQAETVHKLDAKYVPDLRPYITPVIDPNAFFEHIVVPYSNYEEWTEFWEQSDIEKYCTALEAIKWGIKNNTVFYDFYKKCGIEIYIEFNDEFNAEMLCIHFEEQKAEYDGIKMRTPYVMWCLGDDGVLRYMCENPEYYYLFQLNT